jgi:flagellar motor switch protein FliM
MGNPERLTIAMLQQKLPQPNVEASSFEDFYKTVAQLMAAELQLYNSVPVKCTIVGEKLKPLPEVEENRNVFALASEAGKFRIWYDADRSFDHLLCELCLGGSGVPEPQEDGIRPPSNFERRFRSNVLRKLMASVPLAAKRANNVDLEVAIDTEEDLGAPPEKLAGENSVEVTIQVNAFSFTSEITLTFLESELVKCLGGRARAASAKAITAAQALNDCRFAVEAYLKPRQITLDQIVNLEIGQVIPLSVGIGEPVMLSCENKPVFRATISLNGDKVQLSLLSEILESRRKTDVAA